MMIFTAVWLVLAVIVALVAIEKRRDSVRWFLFGMFAWPIALPLILLVKDRSRVAETAR
jgi:hypothetical protein